MALPLAGPQNAATNLAFDFRISKRVGEDYKLHNSVSNKYTL